MITRFAPTPSGYLHAGNAWSFLLTWLLARKHGGKIYLRIDDLDTARFREEYLEDIFISLQWLGLDWDSGPRSPIEFHSSFSQRLRRANYRAALEVLMKTEDVTKRKVYACRCSREKVKRASQLAGQPGIYPGTCRDAGYPNLPANLWQSGKGIESPGQASVLRIQVPSDIDVTLKTSNSMPLIFKPAEEIGDFVLWHRNGEAAYQLASVLDDEALGVDWVVRGRDLLPSTSAQIYLAGQLNATGFFGATFVHHGLLLGPGGKKLSKSTGSLPTPSALTLSQLREQPSGRKSLLGFFAQSLGLDSKIETMSEILSAFDPGQIPMVDLAWEDLEKLILNL